MRLVVWTGVSHRRRESTAARSIILAAKTCTLSHHYLPSLDTTVCSAPFMMIPSKILLATSEGRAELLLTNLHSQPVSHECNVDQEVMPASDIQNDLEKECKLKDIR